MTARKTVANSRALAIGERVALRLGEQIEREYREDRAQAAERLQNAFAEAIAGQRPTAETILYVLELIRHQVIQRALRADGGPGAECALEADSA